MIINKNLIQDNDIILIKTQINQSIKDINKLENDIEFDTNNQKNKKKLNKLHDVLNNLYKLLEDVSIEKSKNINYQQNEDIEEAAKTKGRLNNDQQNNDVDKNNQKVIVNINQNKRRYKLGRAN